MLEFTSNVKDDSPQAINDMIWNKQTRLFTRELHVQLKSSGAEGAAGVIAFVQTNSRSQLYILRRKCPPILLCRGTWGKLTRLKNNH